MGIKQWFIQIAKVITRDDSHAVQASSFAQDIYDSQLLHAQGVVAGVPNQTKVLAIKVGHTRNQLYLLPIKVDNLEPMPSGAMMIYATNPDGSSIVGAVELTNDGKLAINTQQDDLLAILQETLSLLQELKTFGSPTSQAPSPDWVAKASVLQSRLDAMAKYQ
ncbi:hypothetical protein PVA45_08490 (plasmid) [Entomospira entomophila]|uniref:Uncharacterized protein n=1 Tax=Entomospira entomophila TaxID=2719988 RepID=A0A968KS69_9SPIO|nr:hypothetical protein [Entomospira entomophilus]NIZ41503.1 hypothetical protein [Entomospira entomophilus]WDI36413.1 hypothetical protein PVA45_08490 [Entomospira entomophilus]